MIGRSRQPEDYRSVLDPRRVRRTRLIRAGVAVVLIGVLLVVAWRLDSEVVEEPVEAVVPEVAELAPSQSQPPSLPAPFGPAELPEPPVEVPLQEEVARVEAGEMPAAPPSDGSNADSDVPGEAAVEPKPEPEKEPPEARPKEVASVASPPASATGSRGANGSPDKSGARFQVRFDDFGDLAAANALRQTAADAGQPAQVQQRVAVGPFATGRAAGDSLAKLGNERGIKGIVVGGPEAGQWMVQVGVFADAGNAESLRRRLADRDYPVVVHGRVVMGPYRGREAVDQALAKLRAEGAPVSGAQVIALP